jgi:clathrin heavy chain
VSFYIEQHPLELVRLLQVLTPHVDHARVVHQLRKAEHLPLAAEYLKSVQKENIAAVNEALNELYIEVRVCLFTYCLICTGQCT